MASAANTFPEGAFYCGPRYLWTIDELEENAIANLGPMDKTTYAECAEKMNKIAEEKGIIQPKLAIGIKFKEGAAFVKEQPYPILEREWAIFKKDAETMCEYIPNVFVVDGSKFSLPI
ncbi:MAG: hypothetical protein PVI40_00320 [Chlamydiota bacterium]|jgi:hypothetical protein